jgi:hypothetical protein
LAGSAFGAGVSFDYKTQGADWPAQSKKAGNEKWQCDEDQQSPIDLKTTMKKMEIPNDIRRYQYGNFFNRKREWVSDNTVKFSENAAGGAEPGMYFESSYAKNNLKHPTGEFEVA